MTIHRITRLCFSLLWVTAVTVSASAEVLEDVNGDGVISLTTFGDSITYGVGDGVPVGSFVNEAPTPPGPSGYPTRVANQLGIPVDNQGDPGELLTEAGVDRFPFAVQRNDSDLVLIMEGVNDGTLQKSQTEYRRSLQQIINVSIALGKLPVVMTVTPPCCIHEGTRPFARSISSIIRDRAAINDLPLIDVERAWDNTCSGAECELYNLPEGLHPNSKGYTAIAQTVMAFLLGIDIFAQNGPRELESALGLEAGQVIVSPDAPISQ